MRISFRLSDDLYSLILSKKKDDQTISEYIRQLLIEIEPVENKSKVSKKGDFSDDQFESFWLVYPKKINKKGCYKIFMRIKGVEFDMFMESLQKQVDSESWTSDNGKFIPHPMTWLNQERWEIQIESQKKWYER